MSEPANEEIAADAHGLYDATWNEARWREMAGRLVADGLVTWREIATTILGELNPPQVGTSIASSDATRFGFKDNHVRLNPGYSFMPHVMKWLYATSGRCVDCGTRLDLQADHVDGRENYADPRQADLLSNMALRCRRHNVAKRKSHIERAGRTLLPAQQALMWILLEIRPATRRDLDRLCRIYGMTMSDIRFQEAWAMAVWLARDGHYRIADPGDFYDLLQWADGSVTRRFTSNDPPPPGAQLLEERVAGSQVLSLLASRNDTRADLRYFELSLDWLPFNYDLGDRPPTDIAIWPGQGGGSPLAPRGMTVYAWSLNAPSTPMMIATRGLVIATAPAVTTYRGTQVRGLPSSVPNSDLSLVVAGGVSRTEEPTTAPIQPRTGTPQ